VFADPLRRGLDPATIQLGIMDGLPGLERAFPELEWMHLRTTNPIERLHKECKRRTKPMEIVAGIGDRAGSERGDAAADCFDPVEQLVLRFTDEVVQNVKASDEAFSEMQKHFPPQEIVELILTIGYYMAVARLLERGVEVLGPVAVLRDLSEDATHRARRPPASGRLPTGMGSAGRGPRWDTGPGPGRGARPCARPG
jgi:hypothetical protein